MRTGSKLNLLPGTAALFASSLAARLPLAMFGIALLVHAQRITGSFAVAGLVTGAYSIARGAGAPMLGRLVDRHGQTAVLLASALASAALLFLVALLPASAPPALLVVLAAGIGMCTPPLAACVRTLLPEVLADPGQLRAAYAFESTALELTFIFGPALALGLGALWSTRAVLALSGGVLLAATVMFAAHPASRRWRPASGSARVRGGSMRAPAIQTLALIFLGTGAVFGAVDIGVTSATKALGSTAAAGPLLALWGVGSMLGGLAATRLGGGARGSRGLTLLLGTLALGHGALALMTGSVPALGAAILLAGATIAPTYATAYAIAGNAAPTGTTTEAFQWLLTAASTGSSAGAAGAGALAQSSGASAAFLFAGCFGVFSVLVCLMRARTLEETPVPAATSPVKLNQQTGGQR